MFSANENLLLRQAKKKVVGYVESCIPESVLDLGVNVMVMQVSCRAPGCVPLETAIIVVFPHASEELLPGLPESKGGSYKTKILLPLSEVTQQDVYEALPPAFPGGLKTVERLCLQVRDAMFAKITQLFGGGGAGGEGGFGLDADDGDVEGRRLLALYLQESLREYVDRGCVAPEWGQPFPPAPATSTEAESVVANASPMGGATSATTTTTTTGPPPPASPIPTHSKGNLVIRRPKDDDGDGADGSTQVRSSSGSGTIPTPPSADGPSAGTAVPPQPRRWRPAPRNGGVPFPTSSSSAAPMLLSRLAEREHAPGLRQAGCPCCDPDHPSNVADQLLRL